MGKIEEKYESQGWPAIARPDLKPPAGWSLSLATAVNRVRNHTLSPDGRRIAFIWDREELSDVYVMAADGGWPRRVSTERTRVAYWADEAPEQGLVGTDWNWELQAAIGVRWMLNERLALTTYAQWQHFSNGGSSANNRGLNGVGAMAGLSWFF